MKKKPEVFSWVC